jgi:hypothetical protein
VDTKTSPPARCKHNNGTGGSTGTGGGTTSSGGHTGTGGSVGTGGHAGTGGSTGTGGSSSCKVIRFTQPLIGVDGDTSSWSTNDSSVNLKKSSWDLLNKSATVSAWTNGQPSNITSRGTRGLGINGGSDSDEIDNASCKADEMMSVTLKTTMCLAYVEVRSLFTKDSNWYGTETGDFTTSLKGRDLYTVKMTATEPYGTTLGLWSQTLTGSNAKTAFDQIDFYVPDNAGQSEFALAALTVCPCEGGSSPL